MKNISLILSITSVSAGVLSPVRFIQQSAEMSISSDVSTQGRLKTYSLSFRIAGINADGAKLVRQIERADSILVVDAHNVMTTIGAPTLRPSVETEQIIDGRAGSFRGYQMTVEWRDV